MTTLAERLGHPAHARLLIINCDDLGSTRAANVAVYDALRNGVATSASLMVPCPWARDAAAMYRGEDVGVHLTLNSEWDTYRWGPLTHAPSLVDGDGGFPRTLADVWDHADLDEVARECRTQIERAILWGFDVSHLDSHMGTLQLRAEFFAVYLELAVEFGLPLRMPGASLERGIGFPFRRLAEEEGVLFPDHFVYTPVGSRRAIEKALFDLEPGVTEVYVHPGVDTDELRSSHPDWAAHVEDHAFVTADPSLPDLIERAGATLIGYRELRDLQPRAELAGGHGMDTHGLAALCEAAMPHERLTADELGRTCFQPGDLLIGDERGAAVLTERRVGGLVAAFLTLVVVPPGARRRGRGRALVEAAVERARADGAHRLQLGCSLPYYLWPGVDLFDTAALFAFFEAMGFTDDGDAVNMALPTSFRAAPPAGVEIAREATDGTTRFAAEHFPHWVEESSIAVAAGTSFVARDERGETIGFASHSVSRRGWIGPMATQPSLQRGGVGRALLAAAARDIGEREATEACEISWVGPVGFYAKCGAVVSHAFRMGHLDLAAGTGSA